MADNITETLNNPEIVTVDLKTEPLPDTGHGESERISDGSSGDEEDDDGISVESDSGQCFQ